MSQFLSLSPHLIEAVVKEQWRADVNEARQNTSLC